MSNGEGRAPPPTHQSQKSPFHSAFDDSDDNDNSVAIDLVDNGVSTCHTSDRSGARGGDTTTSTAANNEDAFSRPLGITSPSGREEAESGPSPLGFSNGMCSLGASQRMSKVNRLKLQMGLSIGEACTFQTHHSDEARAAPVAAAACQPMSTINDFMFLGSWRDSAEAAVPTLKANGITHILNLAREHSAEGEPDRHPDLVFTTIPMNDDHQEDFYERLLEAHRFINAAKGAGGKVLVHCRRGISRSPAIVISYLMRYNNLSYDEAYAFVSQRRTISLNLAFREFLGSWEPALGRPPSSARKANPLTPSAKPTLDT